MQKKQLQILLPFLLLLGCRSDIKPPTNPYFTDKNDFSIVLEADKPAGILFRGAELHLAGKSVPVLRMRLHGVGDGFWEVSWAETNGDYVRMPSRVVSRSLVSLEFGDSVAELRQAAVPLPGGNGFAFVLENQSSRSFGFVLAPPKADTTWLPPVRVADDVFVVRGTGGKTLAIGSRSFVNSKPFVRENGEWQLEVKPAAVRQVVVVAGLTEREARQAAETTVRRTFEECRADAREALRDGAAFTLNTEDDRSNRVFALLACALLHAGVRTNITTREQIEETAALAPALFLAAREKPLLVFGSTSVSAQEKRDRFRWGSAAYRSVLSYGMVGGDSLRLLGLEILTGLSQLQSDYATADLEILTDESVPSRAMRLAISHVRLAGLMTLGEEVCLVRGDHVAQGLFRTEAQRAARRGQEFFQDAARKWLRHEMPREPENVLDLELDPTATADTVEEGAEVTRQDILPPDTALYLLAGARYGFGLISHNPSSLWSGRVLVDGFTWQRWTAFRFARDLKMTESPDWDSLCTLLLEGPCPGMLAAPSICASESSLPAMAAAFQNLAELYLGVKPEAARRQVRIEPRLPRSWGRTAARIPYAEGFLVVDYDFSRRRAAVGSEQLASDVQVFFGFPLAEGGYLRTQFTLLPGRSRTVVELEYDRNNRPQIRVS